MSLGRDEVRALVDAAYDALVRYDSHLLVTDVNERSITGRLAVYLEGVFPGWNVDCEYNRDLQEIKRLGGDRKFPDVIIHRRGSTENLVVIEAKKSTGSERAAAEDVEKLLQFKAKLGYKFAFAITFPVGSDASTASAAADIAEVGA